MAGGALTEEQRVALDHFANLTTVMAKRQQQVEELGAERRQAAQVVKDLGVPVSDMAKAAGIGVQAVYKLLGSMPR